MKLVFVSRSYPPTLGGMEIQNYELLQALREKVDVVSILNLRGKGFLPVFLPIAFFRLLSASGSADAILLGDAVLSPLGAATKAIRGKPVFCIAHGLDISFDNAFYQSVVVRRSLPRLDQVFAVGNATLDMAVAKGIPAEKLTFIPNGVRPPAVAPDRAPESMAFLEGQPFVLTLGRLIKRKGVLWFLQNVYPRLPQTVRYVIAGSGVEKKQIIDEVSRYENVHYLGEVDEPEKAWLLANAAIFVQPNIPVENDIEGFGIAALEAAASGTMVVASRLEGLRDAITEGLNGVLVEAGDPLAFSEVITSLLENQDRQANAADFQQYTLENFSWGTIAERYLGHIENRLV